MDKVSDFDKAMNILRGIFPFDAVQEDIYDDEQAIQTLIMNGASTDEAEHFAMCFPYIETWAHDVIDSDELDKLAHKNFDEASDAAFGSAERIQSARFYAQARYEIEARKLTCTVMPCWNCTTLMIEVRPLTDELPEYKCPTCGGAAIQYQEGGWGFHAAHKAESEG